MLVYALILTTLLHHHVRAQWRVTHLALLPVVACLKVILVSLFCKWRTRDTPRVVFGDVYMVLAIFLYTLSQWCTMYLWTVPHVTPLMYSLATKHGLCWAILVTPRRWTWQNAVVAALSLCGLSVVPTWLLVFYVRPRPCCRRRQVVCLRPHCCSTRPTRMWRPCVPAWCPFRFSRRSFRVWYGWVTPHKTQRHGLFGLLPLLWRCIG